MKNTDAYKVRLYGMVFLAVLVFSAYFNALSNGFVYDDNIQIIDNPWIKDFKYLFSIFTNHSFGFLEDPGARSYRPLVFLIYSIEYAFFGLEPSGWHLVNIVFHLANSVIVYLTLLYLLPAWDADGNGRWALLAGGAPPAIGAALFAVHPINNEVVSWVGCVPELSYTFFTLSAFYIHIRSDGDEFSGKPGGSYAMKSVSALSFLAALLSKETAVVLPVIIIFYDILVRGIKLPLSLRASARYLPLFISAIVYALMRVNALGSPLPQDRMFDFLSTWQYFINAVTLFASYLGLLLVPAGDYPFQLLDPVFSITEPRALFSVLAAFLALIAGVTAFVKRSKPLYIFAAALLILPLMPALYIPGLSRHAFAIRFTYLPSAGLGILTGLFLKGFMARRLTEGRASVVRAVMVFSVLVLAVSIAWTARRNLVWKDDVTVWRASAAGSPGNYFAHYWLGMAYFKRGMLDEAVRHSEESLMLNASRRQRDVMIEVFARKVLAASYNKARMYEDAVREYREILKTARHDFDSYYNLALIHQEGGRLDEAIEAYRGALAVARKPEDLKNAYNNLANCYTQKRLFRDALSIYEEALRYFPADALLLHNMEVVRRMSGR